MTNRKVFAVGRTVLICCLIMLICYWLTPLIPALFAVPSSDWLECSDVNLGELRPNEKTEFSITIRNQGSKSITLKQPRVSCGCLSSNHSVVYLAPGSIGKLSFSIRSPSELGEFEHLVLLECREAPGLTWPIEVKGRVAAKIWTKPGFINVDLGTADKSHDELVAIFHPSEISIGKVVVDSPWLKIHSVKAESEKYTFVLAVARPQNAHSQTGTGVITAYSRDEKTKIVDIPVRWVCPSLYQCLPAVMDLDPVIDTDGPFQRTLAVFVHDAAKIDDLSVQALQPWVHLEYVDRRTNPVAVRIRLDSSQIPEKIKTPILKLSVDNWGTWSDYYAIRQSPSR